MKDKLLTFFQEAMEQVMQSYNDNHIKALKEANEDKFDFGKYHQECKHAIAHLESLLKLYEKSLSQDEEKASLQKDDFKKLIDQACQRINADS